MNKKPSIVIDCNSFRLRLHRQTLYLLKNPNNIQFWIHPEVKKLAVTECPPNCGEKVRWIAFGDKQCCEFYSKSLISKISKLFRPAWKPQIYKIWGTYLEKEQLILFDLKNAIAISAQEEFKNE